MNRPGRVTHGLAAAPVKGVQREPAAPAPQAAQPRRLGLQASLGNRGMQQLVSALGGSTPQGALQSATSPASWKALIGAGQPLPDHLRAEHGPRWGDVVDRVRVHDHPGAHRLAQAQRARAFSLGQDIVFHPDFYRPDTLAGRRLIAHEMAHVVQQRAGAAGHAVSATSAVHEAAADAAAHAVVNGFTGPVSAGPAASWGIQRDPLTPAELAQRPPPPTDPATTLAKVMDGIRAELDDVSPRVSWLAIDVPLHPADHALNELRLLDARLAGDEKALREFEAVAGTRAAEVHAALVRFQVLRTMLAPALAAANAWHEANPAGESLGMMNERAGTWLVSAGSSQWDKGGVHYVSGALAYVGAFGVAFVDAGEKVASMGYHDAATAVSQAYARGDISWNEGESILLSAAWRALLIAAVTRGAGMATSRLGVLGAEATGLASTTLRYGAVAGAIPGGLSATAALGTQALLTKGLEDRFNSPAAKAIWAQGMPQGRDWAIAIPLGLVLGGLGGAHGVELANEKLVGTVVQTPEGPMKIVAITQLQLKTGPGQVGLTQPGVVVLQPVAARPLALPPPPPTDVVMTFDPATQGWVPAKAAPLEVSPPASPAPAAAPVPPPKPTPTPKLAPKLPPQPAPAPARPPQTAPLAPPVTPNGARAAQRLAQTDEALARANQAADRARTQVARAQADLQAANELTQEAGGGQNAKALVKEAEGTLRRAQAELKPLERSEAAARQEREAVARGGTEVAKIEQEIAALDEKIGQELRRTRHIVPPTGTPEGQAYHRLVRERANALERLQGETQGLTRSLRDQVSAATPGAEARPVALANAAQLDPALQPVQGTPIDVTTGQPMTTSEWSTDHLMSRSEIARDPRFARLTPLQRDAMLRAVPENYLPMTPEANSSKLDLPVNEWIVARAANGKPLPEPMARALRAADLRARAAIEALFQHFLSP